MAGLNKVMLIGNVGKDPEMRYTANGSAVTKFSLAVNRNFTSGDGERREETEWFDIVTWAKLAELCSQFVQKGRQVYVEGRLQTRSWEGQDGQKRTSLDITADNVISLERRPRDDEGGFVGAPTGAGASGGGGFGGGSRPPADDADLDDLPF